VLGQCLRVCGSAAECPEGMGCYEAAEGMSAPPATCFEIRDPALFGTVGCHPIDDPCANPTFCVYQRDYEAATGVCSMRCNGGNDCPGGGRCIEVLDGVHHCLLECESATDCMSPDLRCGAFGEGSPVCVPPGWVGATPPLERPGLPMMPMPGM
jgi:hypothetical protein